MVVKYKLSRHKEGKHILCLSWSVISSFPDVMSHEKRIARHIDTNRVVWTLIDNSKLANHIARLEAIVVKISVLPCTLQFLMYCYFPK